MHLRKICKYCLLYITQNFKSYDFLPILHFIFVKSYPKCVPKGLAYFIHRKALKVTMFHQKKKKHLLLFAPVQISNFTVHEGMCRKETKLWKEADIPLPLMSLGQTYILILKNIVQVCSNWNKHKSSVCLKYFQEENIIILCQCQCH
jgi:hypothetical protein